MRRLAAAAVAANLVVAACSSGLETPAETLRRDDPAVSTFGYVLDTLPDGYELCAISTPSALSLQSDTSASLEVYGDGTLADPYAGPLYGVARFEAERLAELPLGDTTDTEVQGVPARLGGGDSLLIAALPTDAARVLTFQRDDAPGGRVTIQVIVRNDDSADIEALAAAVESGDDTATLPPEALPDGFVGLGDLYQLEGRPQFRFSLDHQAGAADDGSLEDQLTLLGTTGDAVSMEAFRFRASASERVSVGGAPGVAADIGSTGEGPFVVSWLADDGLILRVFSFVIAPPDLLPVAQSARRVDGAEWRDLLEEFEPGSCPR